MHSVFHWWNLYIRRWRRDGWTRRLDVHCIVHPLNWISFLLTSSPLPLLLNLCLLALAHSNKQMQWVDGHLFLVFIHDMLDFQQYFPFICFFITWANDNNIFSNDPCAWYLQQNISPLIILSFNLPKPIRGLDALSSIPTIMGSIIMMWRVFKY